ncbi:RHS repeat-associated core domain-containing protein [Xenorhabdus griffiniae]|uniref:RHS repeat-associated core domain-containing protein n=2 Tax=Xenorhabdus griffiniae TaxID=351672 RepID=A0ABY9XHT5_9GAMM|nr:RHS repeat-associated core domain-containing protein [Xenorhabdus griffiniae]WMV72369.1 RHS repeat-associated core domain-containing protein [Xenorhabdus griffiniae]WNH02047.1 RHS repeat-associated core domain-containing protein [Xenorhabdus griffiniae]
MSVSQNVIMGAAAAGRPSPSPVASNPTLPSKGGKPAPVPPRTEKSTSDRALAFLQSDTFSDATLATSATYAAATGAAVPFAVGLAAGTAGGAAGMYVGDKIGHAIAKGMGMGTVATEGENPAREGDAIAHQNKNAGLWGALGGILLGAVAAVAVGALVVATGGAALVVVAAAAAAGGFVGGTCAGIGAAIGQYGSNKGTIAKGSPNVFFEGKPVARKGDPVVCSDHPPGVVAEGAKTVFANGKPIARLGHRTTCDANINSAAGSISITPETGEALPILQESNKTLQWAVVIAGLLPLPRNKKGVTKSDKPKESTQKQSKKPNEKDTCSDPVDMATGDFLQQWPLLSLPGTLPLSLTRTYRSTENFAGLFGPKWSDDWSQHLRRAGEVTHFTDADGVVYTFHTPEENVFSVNLHAGHYLLFGTLTGGLHLFDRQTQLTLSFEQQAGDKRLLSTIRDRHNNQITFHYADPFGEQQYRLSQVIHSDGYRLLLDYYQNRLASIEYLTGELRQTLVTCRYNPQDYLSECHAFQFSHLWHEYDPRGYMTRWHDTDTTDVSMGYDNRGRVVSVRTPQGYWQDRFLYDDVNKVTTYLDAEGGCTRYWYNENGQITRKIDSLGRETVLEWDLSHQLSETDPLGRKTQFEYTPYGELTQLTLPSGEIFVYDYDEYGQLLQAKLPNGKKWIFHYSEQGALDAVTDPQGRREEYRYNPQGEMLRRVLPDGTQWRYEYEQHQLHQVLAPNGYTTHYEQDGLGRLHSVTDALGQKTRYQHCAFHASPAGSVTEIERPDGVKQHISYDNERRVTAVTDGEGNTTRYTYSAFDLLTQLTRPDGTVLHFGYDRLIRLNSVTLATGETYRYERDLAGQIIRETDFTGRTVEYTYDRAGRRTLIRYPNGQFIRFCYTANDQIQRQEYWQAGKLHDELQSVTDYAYDTQGRLVRATSADAVVEFEYDEAGRLTGERLNGREINREWDDLNDLPTAETLGGDTLHFGYNRMGWLNHFQFNQHSPLSLQHDPLGQETVRESALGFILASRYTATGLLAHQSAGRATTFFRETLQQNDPHFPPQATAVNRSWQYDRACNLRVIDDGRWGQTRYRYNVNGQIIQTRYQGSCPYKEQFSYDANGNLSQHIPTDARGAVAQIVQRQKAGRVMQHGDSRYHYDTAGRLVEKNEYRDGFRPQIWRYRWNVLNQLTQCETPDGSRWHYQYDPFGRRIRKLKVYDGKRASANLKLWLAGRPDMESKADAIVGHDYLWSGDQLIEETPIYADGTPAEDQRIRWLYEPGSLTPSARFERGKLHYIVSDHQGTPREMLNEEGILVWAQRLTTWGKAERSLVIASNDPDYHVNCNLRFMGQYEDEESGLYYNRFRYYSPETGQYISPDPIGLLGGVNPYAYVHNPVNFIDPFGLTDCPASLTREQRQARINELAEANALRRLQEMESMNPRSHFLERHGAQTSLESQLGRATNGANPTTGVQQRTPMAATRFDSHRDQLNAIQRAQTIQRQSGGVVTKATIPYGRRIGEGYSKTGPTYGTSSTATVILTPNGQTITAYPVWGR